MSLLIVIIVVLIVAGLLFVAVDHVAQFAPFAGLIKALILVIAALYVAHSAGLG